jgi:hypothetical protein
MSRVFRQRARSGTSRKGRVGVSGLHAPSLAAHLIDQHQALTREAVLDALQARPRGSRKLHHVWNKVFLQKGR